MINFGVVGTNWITERLINSAKELKDFNLKAVYSRTQSKAEEFAKKYEVTLTFTDLEEMAKSDEIDAVYIASPNSLHAEQAILFLNHDKHVLCEKPLASNVAETKAMITTAKQNNVLLMEAMKSTLTPGFKAIEDNLHKLGKVRSYFSSYCKYSSRYDAYKEGTILNAFNPTFSNGSLMDLGIYCIYPLVTLFGEPTHIQGSAVMLESGVDGAGNVQLLYEVANMEAVMMHSKISTSSLSSEIQGEDATMVIDKISTPENVEIHYKDGLVEKLDIAMEHPSMYYEVEEFIQLIKDGKTESSINTFERSLITIGIIDKARKQIGLVYPADK